MDDDLSTMSSHDNTMRRLYAARQACPLVSSKNHCDETWELTGKR